MNKTDLIEGVVEDCGASKVQAERVVDGIFGRIAAALHSGDSLVLRDFGTLKVHERPAGKGRNPRTGEAVTVPARRVVRFKAGRGLKAAVAGIA